MPAKRACGTGRSSGSLVTFGVEIENLVRGLFALFGFLANMIRTHVAHNSASALSLGLRFLYLYLRFVYSQSSSWTTGGSLARGKTDRA